MSFSLMGLLGLDNACLPHGIAGKLARAITGKMGKSIELSFAGVCVQIGCFFVMLTILYLNHLALLSGPHTGWKDLWEDVASHGGR